MSTWTADELDVLAAATELRISTRRDDRTLRPTVPIWVVRAGDRIYIRSYRAQSHVGHERRTAGVPEVLTVAA